MRTHNHGCKVVLIMYLPQLITRVKMLRPTSAIIFYFIVLSYATPHNILPRIVGGEEAEECEFPFQISIQYFGTHICGGTLINLSTIVSTASCAELGSVSYFNAIAGRHRLSANESSSSQSRRISRIIIHSGYPGPSGYSNDIAILKLLTPFDENDSVRPIEMIGSDTNYPEIATVIGFGSLHEGGTYSDVLRKVDVPIISDVQCRGSYGEEEIEDAMICAGSPGKDACSGDNGSPLIIRDNDGKRYLVGVSSWGIGCGRTGYPGVYTEILYFQQFINSNLS